MAIFKFSRILSKFPGFPILPLCVCVFFFLPVCVSFVSPFVCLLSLSYKEKRTKQERTPRKQQGSKKLTKQHLDKISDCFEFLQVFIVFHFSFLDPVCVPSCVLCSPWVLFFCHLLCGPSFALFFAFLVPFPCLLLVLCLC